jgi:hypothetical protein
MKMKLKGLLLGALGSFLISLPAFAAGVDGDWTGSLDSPNGPVQIDYSFKSDGAKLAIKDGKVDGNNISFAVDVDFGGSPTTIKYTGVVAADSIVLTMDFQGMPINITVKKKAAK